MTIHHPEAASSAAVYGGGGLFGIGYTLGVAEAFIDAGICLSSLAAIGTSAGSWAASALALGVKFHDALDLIGHRVPRFPNAKAGRLRDIAAELFGAQTRCPTVSVIACSLPRFRRWSPCSQLPSSTLRWDAGSFPQNVRAWC